MAARNITDSVHLSSIWFNHLVGTKVRPFFIPPKKFLFPRDYSSPALGPRGFFDLFLATSNKLHAQVFSSPLFDRLHVPFCVQSVCPYGQLTEDHPLRSAGQR